MSDVHLTDPAWVRPVTSGHRQQDIVLAVVLLGASAASTALSRADAASAPASTWWAGAACSVLLAAPLAWRRAAPCSVAVVVVATLITSQVLQVPEQIVAQLCALVALYSAAAWGARRQRTAVVLGILVAFTTAWLLLTLVASPDLLPGSSGVGQQQAVSTQTVVLTLASTLMSYGVVLALGHSSWQSARRLAALALRTRELLQEREHSAAQAVVLDRVRIARELHDVVAHHVSVMGVQAGAARRLLTTAPERAGQSLMSIEDSARAAVGDLHRLLTTLREEDGSDLQAASTLGLMGLPDLARQARSAGTPTELRCEEPPTDLAHVVQVALYRVAQEALTNVRKHAGEGANTTIDLRTEATSIVLEVRNAAGVTRAQRSGPAAAGGATTDGGFSVTRSAGTPAAGLGLLGMRERMSAVGGTLQAGPITGGFTVRATVPRNHGPEGLVSCEH